MQLLQTATLTQLAKRLQQPKLICTAKCKRDWETSMIHHSCLHLKVKRSWVGGTWLSPAVLESRWGLRVWRSRARRGGSPPECPHTPPSSASLDALAGSARSETTTSKTEGLMMHTQMPGPLSAPVKWWMDECWMRGWISLDAWMNSVLDHWTGASFLVSDSLFLLAESTWRVLAAYRNSLVH